MENAKLEQEIVQNFSKSMLEKIQVRHNRYAPLGWKTMDMKRLISLLKGELAELEEAIASNMSYMVQDEAIDVANYAMFIHELFKPSDTLTPSSGITFSNDTLTDYKDKYFDK